MPKIYAIILAAGSSDRFKHEQPKQFVKIAGKTVLEHTIEIFERNNKIDQIILVIRSDYRLLVENIVIKNKYKKVKKILNGGKTRKDSSFIGLMSIEDDDSYVLIHDAVRPFLSQKIINKCIEALNSYDAVDVAIPSADTIIQTNNNDIIENIPERKLLRRGQTPQAFKTKVIKEAHMLAKNDPEINVTDDCALILRYKLGKIFVIPGDRKNIKITYMEDIYLADKLFQLNSAAFDSNHENNLDLSNKVIVVFGGRRGIGKSICEVANKTGARVHSFSRKSGCNISNSNDVKNALASVSKAEGQIDFIVNTAAIMRTSLLESKTRDEILEEINTNYIGAVNVVKESIPYLKTTQGAIALFTSSSYTRGRALYSIYSSTKAAIVNLVQAVAEELLQDGIKINVINPERTLTPMRRENFGQEPRESLLDPVDVAKITLLTLTSEFTGQVVDVRRN